jgi:hypothetical protein
MNKTGLSASIVHGEHAAITGLSSSLAGIGRLRLTPRPRLDDFPSVPKARRPLRLYAGRRLGKPTNFCFCRVSWCSRRHIDPTQPLSDIGVLSGLPVSTGPTSYAQSRHLSYAASGMVILQACFRLASALRRVTIVQGGQVDHGRTPLN